VAAIGARGWLRQEVLAPVVTHQNPRRPNDYCAAIRRDCDRFWAIVDADSDLILGATVLGIEGGEIMSILEVAMMGNLPYTALRDGTFAHPTLAESLNNLFMAMDSGS